jgi:hypothetical protein
LAGAWAASDQGSCCASVRPQFPGEDEPPVTRWKCGFLALAHVCEALTHLSSPKTACML